MQILEFIMANYAWFLGSAIVILLAIIGYVADKTNFGQGKTDVTEEKNINLDRINSMGIDQLYTENVEKEIEQQREIEMQVTNDQNLVEQNVNEKIDLTNSTILEHDPNVIENVSDIKLNENYEVLSDNVENKQIDSNLASFIASTENLNKKVIGEIKNSEKVEASTDSVLSEESFNDFNKEFDILLPKKEVIDSDILTDIEDLEFDKTQKLDFGDISSFDNIKLPNIKRINKEEHDIWKF